MAAQNPNLSTDEKKMLPREPLDLPTEPLDLPRPEHQQAKHQNTVETILEWTAPGRPFKKRSRQY